MYFGVVALNYSTNNFNPTLLKELGYTSAAAQVGRPEFVEVKLIRPDSLDSSVCRRECFLSGILLSVDIHQQPVLAFAIRSSPWQRWFRHPHGSKITCSWTGCRIHGALFHHQCWVHRAANGCVMGHE